jgi:isochorismate pyruvate lyase
MIICETLDEVRSNIDLIDKEIITLIAQRSEFVKQAAKFKKDEDDVKAPARVEKVIEKVRAESVANNLNPNITEAVYRTMIDKFIKMELNVKKLN